MHWSVMLLRLLLALVLGGLAGLDRERRRKPAGLKTYAMVAIGSASFTLISLELIRFDAGTAYDPIRLVVGVIGGIGFLGAGTIIQAGGGIHGITTAAGIWMVGAIGVACGAGFYSIALLTFGVMMLVLFPIRFLETRWVRSGEAQADDES